MPISRGGVETHAYLPTDSGRLRVQNDIKERNATRRGSLDEAQKARRGNTYVYTSATGNATKTVPCNRRPLLCPDVALVRIPRTVSQVMPATSLLLFTATMADHTPPRCGVPSLPREAPILHLYGCLLPTFDVQKHPWAIRVLAYCAHLQLGIDLIEETLDVAIQNPRIVPGSLPRPPRRHRAPICRNQLPDLRVGSSSTDDPPLRGALPISDFHPAIRSHCLPIRLGSPHSLQWMLRQETCKHTGDCGGTCSNDENRS
jgi:hypothetical protein